MFWLAVRSPVMVAFPGTTMLLPLGPTAVYSSLKLLFVYWNAVRSGVPVPSFGAAPTLIVCCAIIYVRGFFRS
ncbi:MAG: hypothetical protein ACK55Z_01850 [bacterium]